MYASLGKDEAAGLMTGLAQHNLSFLVVDDDRAVGMLLARCLDRLGYHAEWTSDPSRLGPALASGAYSHIMLDLQMPDVNGLQLLSATEATDQKCEIILVSGHGDRVLQSAMRAARARGFSVSKVLAKPFSLSSLSATIQESCVDPGTSTSAHIVPRQAANSNFDGAEILSALERREIQPWLQPKISLRTGDLVGFEALARWRHREQGLLSPSHFLQALSDCGLSHMLFVHMVQQCCEIIGELRPKNLSLAVNATPETLSDRFVLDYMQRVAATQHHAVDQIEIEVIEAGNRRLSDDEIDALLSLKMMGFSLVMDDYGAGWSSSLRFLEVPFSQIKLDRDFISGVASSRETAAMIQAALQGARSLGAIVTAEGVEDYRTLARVAEIGCDLAQGFFIAPPMDVSSALAWSPMPHEVRG